MALLAAILLADKIEADFSKVRPLAQVIMTHQTVKIDRTGQPHIAGVVRHLRHLGQVVFETLYSGIAPFEGCALVKIEDQENFVLVIKGKHLEGHRTRGSQAHGRDGQTADEDKEGWRHASVKPAAGP